MIEEVRGRFNLRRAIFVGDWGMVSQKLLDELDSQHIEYIVGVRMRMMKAVEQILKTGGRYKVVDNLRVKEVWSDDADRPAKAVGTNREIYRQAKAVVDSKNQDVIQAMDKGTFSSNKGINII